MKFRFCGGLDAPDWLLTEVAIVAKLVRTNHTAALLLAFLLLDFLLLHRPSTNCLFVLLRWV
jgi:hypothetical protein